MKEKDSPDLELVKKAQKGDRSAEEELLRRYKSLVRKKAGRFYIIGGDDDDVLQEGMIGLYNAIGKYDESNTASFRTFAVHCINNQIISAIRSANTRKNQILNEYISFEEPLPLAKGRGADADSIHVEDTLASDPSDSPEEMLIIKDIAECIISNDERIFSEYEMDALKGILQGKGKAEIARALGRTEESVENTLQRVRRKAIECVQGF